MAGLCAYEVLAICPGSPLPTLTELGRRHPAIKYALEAMLWHHWHIEAADAIRYIREDDILEITAGVVPTQ